MVGGAGGRTQWIAHRAEHRANVNQEQHFSRWHFSFQNGGEKKTVKTYADVRCTQPGTATAQCSITTARSTTPPPHSCQANSQNRSVTVKVTAKNVTAEM